MPAAALNALELTGRATTHVVTLSDLACTLHPAAAEAFRALRTEAAGHGIDLQPVSTFRDFPRQLAIWNAKCRGERDLFDRDGTLLDFASLDEDALVTAILHWSALPGASRHHWGTEIDVIDGTALEPGARPALQPEEYAPGGRYARLEAWMAPNLARFGFYRPYAVDRGGYQPEPWHLSFAPVAQAALAAFHPWMLAEALGGVELGAAAAVMARLPEIYERYVLNVERPPAAALDFSPGTRPS